MRVYRIDQIKFVISLLIRDSSKNTSHPSHPKQTLLDKEFVSTDPVPDPYRIRTIAPS